MRCCPLALLVLPLLPHSAPAQTPDRLAASLLWSDAYTVGRAHEGSGLRVTTLDRPAWRARSSRGAKSFRVRRGAGRPDSPLLWLAAGDLAWAVGLPDGGGRRLTGPNWVQEVLDILEEEERLWLAWAGGVACRGGDGAWQDRSRGLPATFTPLLCRWRGQVWAGTEKGLARWDEEAGRFLAAGLAGTALRAFLPRPEALYIGTFRHGAYRLRPGAVPEPFGLEGCTVESLVADGPLLYAAAGDRGVMMRGLEGNRYGAKELGHWLPLRRWEVDASALALVPGGGEEGRPALYAGTMGKGAWLSRDGGATWRPFGLERGHVTSLALYRSRSLPPRPDYAENPDDPPREAMRKWFLRRCRRTPRSINFFTLRWALDDEALRPFALQRARELLAEPRGDMFFSYPAVGAWYHCRELLPPALQANFRRTLLGYPAYRGDTENHLCMWHAALYLAAAAFPEAGPEEWHTGRSSAANLAFARDYLYRWMERVARRGQMEYDSPHYMIYFFGALHLLRDFAPEEKMRQAAEAMLHLLLVDYAADHFKGIYGGGHSREPRWAPFRMDWDSAASLAFLHWGAKGKGEPRFTGHAAWACLGGYRCPEVIRRIARDRSRPVMRYECKRVRNRWRYHGADRNPLVFKTHFLTPHFSLGATQGGILQPVQQHTWDACWRDDQGRARTLFTLHPFMNIAEWSTFFPEDPLRMRTVARNTKGTYYREDKWVGASPYEHIFHHRQLVVAFYRVPPGELADHIDGYLPAPPAKVARRKGWYAVAGGPVFAALWSSAPGRLTPAPEEGSRLRVKAGKRAFIALVEEAGKWRSLEAFLDALTATPVQADEKASALDWQWPGLEQGHIHCDLEAGLKVGRIPVPRPEEKLFAGPWLDSRLGSGVIRITHGEESLTLDFPALLE